MIYPNEKKGLLREEDRFRRFPYTPSTPFFLSPEELSIYESHCKNEGGSCTNSPYPTFLQPACQCKELLDRTKFEKGT